MLWLYLVLIKPETPKWARGTIVGALAYFIWPADAVPDFLPMVGYTDDLGVLTAAVATVAMYIDEDVKNKARRKMEDWFGPAASRHFTKREATARLLKRVRVLVPFQGVDTGVIGYVERFCAIDEGWELGIRWDRSPPAETPDAWVTKGEYEGLLKEEPSR